MMRAVLKLDFWFVQVFQGLDTLGLYSVASNIGETLYLVPNTLGVVVLSFIADRTTRDDATHRTATMCRLFFVPMIALAVFVSPFSSDLFEFAFGAEFRGSGPLLNVLLLGIVPNRAAFLDGNENHQTPNATNATNANSLRMENCSQDLPDRIVVHSLKRRSETGV